MVLGYVMSRYIMANYGAKNAPKMVQYNKFWWPLMVSQNTGYDLHITDLLIYRNIGSHEIYINQIKVTRTIKQPQKGQNNLNVANFYR